MKRTTKRIIAFVLTFVFCAGFIPCTETMNASAATGLNKSSATVYECGGNTTLTYSGSGTVTWSSSNTKYATVSKTSSKKATVYGKKANGSKNATVTITATVKKKVSGKTKTYKYTCKVTVKPFTISGSSSVKKGKTITLKYNGYNGVADINWKSSSSSVLKRNGSNGFSTVTFKGVKKGKVTVSCTYQGVTHKKTITVK